MSAVFGVDLLRSLVASLAAAILGLVCYGLWQAWRERDMPPPTRRAPFSAVMAFGFSYVLLLLHVMLERLVRLGAPVTYITWLAFAALIGNIVSLYIMLRYTSKAPSLGDLRWAVRWLNRVNRVRYEQLHPGEGTFHATRFQDDIPKMKDDELREVVQQADSVGAGSRREG